MIQADRRMCKESRVVLQSLENTTHVILAKTGIAIAQKRLQYIIIDANKQILAKADDFLP